MVNRSEMFDRLERSPTAKNLDEAVKKLANNVIGAYNFASPDIDVPNKIKAPPWDSGKPSKRHNPVSGFA